MTRSEDRQVLFHPTAESLRKHFAKQHYVCDLCIDVPFGAATAQELKQHKQEEHGPTKRCFIFSCLLLNSHTNCSTGERIVQVEWNYAPTVSSRERDDRNYRGRLLQSFSPVSRTHFVRTGRGSRGGRGRYVEEERAREVTERQRISSGDKDSPEESQLGFELQPGDFPQLAEDSCVKEGLCRNKSRTCQQGVSWCHEVVIYNTLRACWQAQIRQS